MDDPSNTPRCLCGAQLDDDTTAQCRKCRARTRWQRRTTNRRRRRHHHRPGPFNAPQL